MSCEVALQQLKRDLRTDRVLTLTQVETRYQLGHLQLEAAGFLVFERFVGTTRHTKVCSHLFVAEDKKILEQHENTLRHLAGVAAMRQALGAEAHTWSSAADASFALLRPDALWRTSEGTVAIEFDAGSYDPEQLRSKVAAFSNFAGQVWGAASRARAARLSRLLKGAANDALALHVSWDQASRHL